MKMPDRSPITTASPPAASFVTRAPGALFRMKALPSDAKNIFIQRRSPPDRVTKNRRVIAALAAALMLAACARGGQGQNGEALSITIEQSAAGPWRVVYDFAAPPATIDLGASIGGYRARHWRVETDGAALVERDGRDFIVFDGAPLATISALVEPAPVDLRKDYEPFAPMGDGGMLVYTGHFIPYREDGAARAPALLTIVAAEGARVSAFGETSSRFVNWKSPFDHPAFIYVGPRTPTSEGPISVIVDASAPDWVKAEIATLAPNLSRAFDELLGEPATATADLFVSIGDPGEAGKLSYSGDALPGQYQMTLSGDVWRQAGDQALAVIRRSTAHEAAHLWQHGAAALSAGAPGWIHEGGADALAAEALRVAGYWSADDAEADLALARAVCAQTLKGRSLVKAEADGAWDGVYACGHVLTALAAGPEGAGSFWREFLRRARIAGGYDAALFFALAQERAGPGMALALRDLARINNAQPGPIIEGLFARLEAGSAH